MQCTVKVTLDESLGQLHLGLSTELVCSWNFSLLNTFTVKNVNICCIGNASFQKCPVQTDLWGQLLYFRIIYNGFWPHFLFPTVFF